MKSTRQNRAIKCRPVVKAMTLPGRSAVHALPAAMDSQFRWPVRPGHVRRNPRLSDWNRSCVADASTSHCTFVDIRPDHPRSGRYETDDDQVATLSKSTNADAVSEASSSNYADVRIKHLHTFTKKQFRREEVKWVKWNSGTIRLLRSVTSATFFYHAFTFIHECVRDIDIAIQSVHLSVRLSVTLRYCVKTAKHIVEILLPPII